MLPEKLSETLTMVTPSLVDQGEGNKTGFFAKKYETKFTDTFFIIIILSFCSSCGQVSDGRTKQICFSSVPPGTVPSSALHHQKQPHS